MPIMLCSTHTVQSTFPAKLLPDPGQLRILVRQYVCLSLCLLVCLLVCLSANWQMELQRHRNWVWKCLPRTQLGSCFPSTHSTGPFKSDPCADWAGLISASSRVSYPQLFVSVHLMHNFRLQLNKTRTKPDECCQLPVAMATLFPFSLFLFNPN